MIEPTNPTPPIGDPDDALRRAAHELEAVAREMFPGEMRRIDDALGGITDPAVRAVVEALFAKGALMLSAMQVQREANRPSPRAPGGEG